MFFKTKNEIPVLIAIFNRPQKVQALIDVLRIVKPKKLFVAADGPRGDKPNEILLCEETRGVLNQIDWPCDIHKKFSEKNLGLSESMEQAIDWFFEQNEAGIIFEDDCIPHPDFFDFALANLNEYWQTENILMISATNFQNGQVRGSASYFFSHYPRIWGWATWKRAWKLYDKGTKNLKDCLETGKLKELFKDKKEQLFWENNFKKPYVDVNGKQRLTWATTWAFSVFNNKGLTIVPNKNLLQNIGYGPDSTHTNSSGRGWSIKAEALGLDIKHPEKIECDEEADRYYFKTQHYKNFWDKLYNKLNVFLDYIHVKPTLVRIIKKLTSNNKN